MIRSHGLHPKVMRLSGSPSKLLNPLRAVVGYLSLIVFGGPVTEQELRSCQLAVT